MELLVPNYSCLQNPWLGGYRPQIPVLSVLCPQLNLLNPPPRTIFLGTPLSTILHPETFAFCTIIVNANLEPSKLVVETLGRYEDR